MTGVHTTVVLTHSRQLRCCSGKRRLCHQVETVELGAVCTAPYPVGSLPVRASGQGQVDAVVNRPSAKTDVLRAPGDAE